MTKDVPAFGGLNEPATGPLTLACAEEIQTFWLPIVQRLASMNGLILLIPDPRSTSEVA